MGLHAKRCIDILVASLLLLMLAPVLLWVAWRVRHHLGSPVLFCQTRIGLNEKPFLLYKFRTMRAGTGDDAARLHPFGLKLRASSLDELPELWNILRGDMSLVGPRPLLPEYLPYYTPSESARHRMRPGITGLAQVSGRNALSWEARLAHDSRYVQEWRLWKDVVILWRTVLVVLRRDGISAEGHVTMPRLDVYRQAMKDSHGSH